LSDERYFSVQQFLYKEARLLDNRRYREWLGLTTEDVHYLMPTRHNRLRDGRDEEWEVDKELDDLPFFDEDRHGLTMRVERLYTGMAWAEEPPSRTRHVISNIEVEDGDTEDEVRVFSNFLVYRNRLEGMEGDEDLLSGARRDVLRRVDGEWRIARRLIVPDFVVLKAQNLSLFF
jgi:3-phenylpropionate/cinnamic acid dioxygenase small subunit